MGKKLDARLAKVGGPPDGIAWVWHTIELRSSPAWKARSTQLARLLDVLEMEHLRHGGAENGHLNQTFGQIEDGGISRKYIATAIDEGEALGLLVVKRGVRVSPTESYMTKFRLTYLWAKVVNPDYQNGRPYYVAPTDDWKHITQDQATAIAERMRRQRANCRGSKNRIRCPEREPNQFPKGNRDSSLKGTGPTETRRNAGPEIASTVPEREPPSISWGGSTSQNDTPSDTLDALISGCAVSPTDRLRSDLKDRLNGAPRGEQGRLAKAVGLSRPQVSNFLAGRFNVNHGALVMLREYADGRLECGTEEGAE